MFGWLSGPSRADQAYAEALAAMRAVIAAQLETIQKLAEKNGSLEATVAMQFADLRALKAGGIPASVAAPAVPLAPPVPKSPLLAAIAAAQERAEPPQESGPKGGPFDAMSVSGGNAPTRIPLATRKPA